MAKKPTQLDPHGWCFPKATLTFLKNLKANNNRDWFTKNKTSYELAVKQPAEEFSALMTDALSDLTGLAHTAKIFRIHRDVRFSKDKTPYNDHLHISFLPDLPNGPPLGWHFGLEPGRLTVGTGIFGFKKPALESYRKRVAGSDGDDLAKILDPLVQKGARLNEPELKRVPAPFEPDHAHADLLRRKGLNVWLDLETAKMATKPDIVTACTASFRTIKPVFDWLLDD
ncbi:MAG: DUF2461 domain-containing protein [Verrucomicrobia bacterium]|nr:DUF2461 domain-containing protein [Verrucomicrobiota bacterium]